MEKEKIQSSQKLGYLMILASGILWGTIGLFVTTLSKFGVGSLCSAFLRIFFGALILIPIMLCTGGKKLFRIDKRGICITIVLGVFSQAMFNYFYSESINRTGVATASVLLYSAPVFVTIMSVIIYKEKLTGIKVISTLVNVAGCCLTVTGGQVKDLVFSPLGVIAGILAGFLYGLMTIISKLTTDKYNPLTILFYSFMFGSIALAVIVRPWESAELLLSKKVLLTAVGFGLVPTVGSYMFYMNGLKKKLEVSKVPIIASVEIIVASIIGVLVFSEQLGLANIAGVGLVILSIAIRR